MPNLKAVSSHLTNHPTALRSAVIFAALLVIASVLRFTGNDSSAFPFNLSSDLINLTQSSQQLSRPTIASRARMREITDRNTDLVYLPAPNILFMTLAKGGTTSTWNWLYRGLTGRKQFDKKACETYVQDVRSPCWRDQAIHLYLLPEQQQWRILTSNETLRVAIQRNPFERIISSFKSKYTCEDHVYGTDLRNRATMVPQLRRHAGLPPGSGCMNITEFAQALDATRQKVGTPGHQLASLRRMDVHVRPQEFFFDEIDYDIVLDVNELAVSEYLQPIINRLKYKELVKDGIEHRHASTGSNLMIPEEAARMIYLFALESKPGNSRYLASKQ